MATGQDISSVIARKWVSAEGAGLAEGVDASNACIRAMTDAVAAGIVSGGMVKGVFVAKSAASSLAVSVSVGLAFDATSWTVRPTVSASALVMVWTSASGGAASMSIQADASDGIQLPQSFAAVIVLAV